jgi:hypothetical protein
MTEDQNKQEDIAVAEVPVSEVKPESFEQPIEQSDTVSPEEIKIFAEELDAHAVETNYLNENELKYADAVAARPDITPEARAEIDGDTSTYKLELQVEKDKFLTERSGVYTVFSETPIEATTPQSFVENVTKPIPEEVPLKEPVTNEMGEYADAVKAVDTKSEITEIKEEVQPENKLSQEQNTEPTEIAAEKLNNVVDDREELKAEAEQGPDTSPELVSIAKAQEKHNEEKLEQKKPEEVPMSEVEKKLIEVGEEASKEKLEDKLEGKSEKKHEGLFHGRPIEMMNSVKAHLLDPIRLRGIAKDVAREELKLNVDRSEFQMLRRKHADLEAHKKKIESKLSSAIERKSIDAAYKQIAKYKKQQDKITEKQDSLKSKISSRESTLQGFEERRAPIVNKMAEKIDRKLEPHKENREAIILQRQHVESKLREFMAETAGFKKELREFEQDPDLKNIYKAEIKAIRRALAVNEQKIQATSGILGTITSRYAKVEHKINGWDNESRRIKNFGKPKAGNMKEMPSFSELKEPERASSKQERKENNAEQLPKDLQEYIALWNTIQKRQRGLPILTLDKKVIEAVNEKDKKGRKVNEPTILPEKFSAYVAEYIRQHKGEFKNIDLIQVGKTLQKIEENVRGIISNKK